MKKDLVIKAADGSFGAPKIIKRNSLINQNMPITERILKESSGSSSFSELVER
jgi:hypothetical protein